MTWLDNLWDGGWTRRQERKRLEKEKADRDWQRWSELTRIFVNNSAPAPVTPEVTPDANGWAVGDVGYFDGFWGQRNEPFAVAELLEHGSYLVALTRPGCPQASLRLGASLLRKHMIHPLAQDRKYGWHRSTRPSPHPRYAPPAHHEDAANLPKSVDLEPECPPVYDQLQLGSCTANALAGLVQFLLLKLGLPSFVPSRLMIYFGERAIEGTKGRDSGANGDDGMTFLQTKGVCPETAWPYDQGQFTRNPPPAAWAEAVKCKLSDPVTIDNTDIAAIKSRLASGYPIAFGFDVYPDLESDEVARTGLLPLPGPHEESIGGHETLMVGYDDVTQLFKVRNSWGPGWGLRGYFLMPYAYATDPRLASDFRSAGKVS